MNLKTFCSLSCSALLLTVFMCKEDSNPSGPGSNSIIQEEIKGQWYEVQETESWDYVEDGVQDKDSETETFSLNNTRDIIAIAPGVITFYSKGEDNQSCYDVSTSNYSISGNSMLGEDFNGEESEDGEKYSWSTKIWMNGKQLNVEMTESETFGGEGGWEKITIVYERYTGTIPPANWPSKICTNKKANQKNGFTRSIR